MKNTLRKLAVAATFAALLSSVAIQSAQADTTWISGPVLSNVTISAPGSTATGSGAILSTQTTTFTLAYHGLASNAGKFAQVNLFDVTTGLSFALASTPTASSTGCDQQVLGGDSRSCMFKLDGSGSATITGTVSGVNSASGFKYILLSGPNIAQTAPGIVAFAVPNTTVKALVPSTKAMIGGAAVMRFRFFNGTTPAPAVKANVALTGRGDNLSHSTVTSDANGYVWIYVASLGKKTGASTVTVTVDGTSNKATAAIKWVTGKLGK